MEYFQARGRNRRLRGVAGRNIDSRVQIVWESRGGKELVEILRGRKEVFLLSSLGFTLYAKSTRNGWKAEITFLFI